MYKCFLSKEKKIKTMNSKTTTNSQLSTTTYKQKQKQTKQTTKTGTESQKWRSHGGLSVGRGVGENGVKGTGNKNLKWWVQNSTRNTYTIS